MKIGSAVVGLHLTVLLAFTLTQGCVTTESQGSGRGAGAKHKGPWRHEHKGNVDDSATMLAQDYTGSDSSMYDPVIIDQQPSSTMQPVVAPAPSYSGATETYIVQKGDVLSRLAVRFDTTTQTLISMNNLSNPDVLYVGQELQIPAGSKARQQPVRSSSPSIKKGGEYTIQKGDTLSGIASAAGVSLSDLRAVNNLSDDRIYAGDTLSIPQGGSIPAKKQQSKPAEPVVQAATVEPAPAPVAEPEVAPVAESDSMQVEAVIDHVVYPGETLDDIARQYSVSKAEIMRLNNISDEASVKEQQRLRIPIPE